MESEEWRVESEEWRVVIGGFREQASRAPAPDDGADHPKVKKQELFQAKINTMLDVSSTRLFTLHSPLFTVVSGKRLMT